MTDDLGALLDLAVNAVLASAPRLTDVVLPKGVTFVFAGAGSERLRLVDRAELLALVEATRTGTLYARMGVSVLGIHDDRTVIHLRESPMAAPSKDVFRPSGVLFGGSRIRADGTVDWTSPITRAELEANGRAALEESGRG